MASPQHIQEVLARSRALLTEIAKANAQFQTVYEQLPALQEMQRQRLTPEACAMQQQAADHARAEVLEIFQCAREALRASRDDSPVQKKRRPRVLV